MLDALVGDDEHLRADQHPTQSRVEGVLRPKTGSSNLRGNDTIL